MNKIPASLRSDFSDCRFAPQCVPVCSGIGGDFSGIRSQAALNVIRYVERNALRANLVDKA
jgi:hypothetical protein